MPDPLFVLMRLLVAAFFLGTFGYASLNCSPFAFDMFIRPQLFPLLTSFVAWHHLWFAGAWAASTATLAPHFDWRVRRLRSARIAHALALGYAAVMGAAMLRLLWSPFLPTLWNDGRALPVALLSVVPLVWLAAIDHFAAAEALSTAAASAGTLQQRRLFAACFLCASFFWAVHFGHAAAHVEPAGGGLAWLVSAAWTLTLAAAAFAALNVVLSLVAAIAARTRRPWRAEYASTVALLAMAFAAFLDTVILRTVSLPAASAHAASLAGGVALAATWSGLALRRADPAAMLPVEVLFAPRAAPRRYLAALLVAVAVAGPLALNAVERLDWDFVLQRTIVLAEALVVFGCVLRLTETVSPRRRSRILAWAPAGALAAVLLAPAATARLSAWSGDGSLAPSVAFERHAGREVAFALLAGAMASGPGFDPDYYRFLQLHADFSGTTSISVPDVDLRAPAERAVHVPGPGPDIFVIVVDSLRRDYLSPYNAAVTFTPNIARFAEGNFAFQNAFTRHGGTELAMPSIWAGAAVVRKVRSQGFERMNALEKLVHSDGYRVAINDFTVAEHLRRDTPVTTIDAGVPSVETDLCRNLASLRGHLEATAPDARPVFGYFAPMNVHILNTRRGGQTSLDGDYPGFYAPYASRLKRLDGCFGSFIDYLKATGRYDNSVVVLTSDHGDSLGEGGYWGHAMWLFPEDVRVPLIVHVPERLRPGLTTDLARLAFSTDIAPTLYALLGHQLRTGLGPMFGEPLFVPSGRTLSDRRREAFLLTSSYGATYALLRRNGRLLYVTDIAEWHESAYDLSSGVLGAPLVVDSGMRRLNQREIKKQVADIAAFYRYSR
jgi:hypothetical protein